MPEDYNKRLQESMQKLRESIQKFNSEKETQSIEDIPVQEPIQKSWKERIKEQLSKKRTSKSNRNIIFCVSTTSENG